VRPAVVAVKGQLGRLDTRVGFHRAPGRSDYRVSSDHVSAVCHSPVLKAFAGGRLFGAASGSGEPWVLALHGWRRTHRDFDRVLVGVDGIALDLAGFGAAPAPPDGWSTSEYAKWIAPVLGELSPGAVVVGHSFGGRVATHLAALHPDRIGALVLTGVPLVANPDRSPGRVPAAFRIGRALHRAGLVSDARMEALRCRYGSSDYRSAGGVMRDVLVKAVNETYEASFVAFPGPVELIWGENDREVPVAVATRAQSLRSGVSLTLCPETAHLVPTEAPSLLRDVILRHRPELVER
jgi:pimeloyl-ACP methyl ester carboxylesterase